MKTLVPFAALAAFVVLSGCFQHLPTAAITSTAQSPQTVVSNSGQVVGQDPDANIRTEMTRNASCYLGQCGE